MLLDGSHWSLTVLLLIIVAKFVSYSLEVFTNRFLGSGARHQDPHRLVFLGSALLRADHISRMCWSFLLTVISLKLAFWR